MRYNNNGIESIAPKTAEYRIRFDAKILLTDVSDRCKGEKNVLIIEEYFMPGTRISRIYCAEQKYKNRLLYVYIFNTNSLDVFGWIERFIFYRYFHIV